MEAPPAIVFELPRPSVEEQPMLDAIAAVENWHPGSVGRSGAWGKFQILPATWRQYSRLPQRSASPAEERRVAGELLKDIRTGLRRLHIPESAYWVALVWRGGLTNLETHRIVPEWREYATRAETVFNLKKL